MMPVQIWFRGQLCEITGVIDLKPDPAAFYVMAIMPIDQSLPRLLHPSPENPFDYHEQLVESLTPGEVRVISQAYWASLRYYLPKALGMPIFPGGRWPEQNYQ